jgi:hypothetical protein
MLVVRCQYGDTSSSALSLGAPDLSNFSVWVVTRVKNKEERSILRERNANAFVDASHRRSDMKSRATQNLDEAFPYKRILTHKDGRKGLRPHFHLLSPFITPV